MSSASASAWFEFTPDLEEDETPFNPPPLLHPLDTPSPPLLSFASDDQLQLELERDQAQAQAQAQAEAVSLDLELLEDADFDDHTAFLSTLRSGSQSRRRRRGFSQVLGDEFPIIEIPEVITSRLRSTATDEEERAAGPELEERSPSPILPLVSLRANPSDDAEAEPDDLVLRPLLGGRTDAGEDLPRLLGMPSGEEARGRRVSLIDPTLDEAWELNWRVEMEEARELDASLREADEEGEEEDDDDDGWALYEGSRVWRNDPVDVARSSRVARGGVQARPINQTLASESLFESANEVEWRRRSQAPPPTSYTRPSPPAWSIANPSTASGASNSVSSRLHLESLRATSNRWSFWGNTPPNPSVDWGPPLPFSSRSRGGALDRALDPMATDRQMMELELELEQRERENRDRNSPRDRGRDRDETNAVIAQTLRTKKDCLLVYCGARKEEALPKGFTIKVGGGDPAESTGGGGCGALVCARGLAGEQRLFDKNCEKEDAISSDLPLVAEKVGDVERGKEVKSKRGLSDCQGCRTKDIGCRACGNILGFRVVRSCNPCSKSRVVSTEGLLWHFRAACTTSTYRLNGITPPPYISLSPPSSPPPSPPPRSRPSRLSSSTGRLELRQAPEDGTKMVWSNVPHPQVDWEDGLVGEPREWVNEDDGEEEDWGWVEGLGRICRRGRELERAEPASLHSRSTPTRDEWSVPLPSWQRVNDRTSRPPMVLPTTSSPWALPLAAASRPVQVPSDSSNIFSPRSPPRSPPALVRTHAIRVSRALSPNNASTGRRVRQRRSVEIERVVREAGYGSDFVESGRSAERERERARVRRRALESPGRRGSVGLVGR